MHFDDVLRNGKPKTGPAFLLGDRVVGLLKFLKQLGLICFRYSWPGIANSDFERAVIRASFDAASLCLGAFCTAPCPSASPPGLGI